VTVAKFPDRRPRQVEPDALYEGPGPWTHVRLILARRCTDEADSVLKDCGYTMRDLEVARWTLLGRSYDEALCILNGQGAGGCEASRMAGE
jgi:hypothetical protein